MFVFCINKLALKSIRKNEMKNEMKRISGQKLNEYHRTTTEFT